MIINIQDNVTKSKALSDEVEDFLSRGGVIRELSRGFSGACTTGWNNENPNISVIQKKIMRQDALDEGIKRRKRECRHQESMREHREQSAEQKIILGAFIDKCVGDDMRRLADACGMNHNSIRKAAKGNSVMYKKNWQRIKDEIKKFVHQKPKIKKPKVEKPKPKVRRVRANNMDLMREAKSQGKNRFIGICGKHGQIEMQINGVNYISYKCPMCRKESEKKSRKSGACAGVVSDRKQRSIENTERMNKALSLGVFDFIGICSNCGDSDMRIYSNGSVSRYRCKRCHGLKVKS